MEYIVVTVVSVSRNF